MFQKDFKNDIVEIRGHKIVIAVNNFPIVNMGDALFHIGI